MSRLAESTVLTMENDEVIVITRGVTFPEGGGAQNGTFHEQFSLTEHLRVIVREELYRFELKKLGVRAESDDAAD